MTDRELLELAGKAEGVELLWKWSDAERASVSFTRHPNWYAGGTRVDQPWNPLVDDGDCARMEAKLAIDVRWNQYVFSTDGDCEEVGVMCGDYHGTLNAAEPYRLDDKQAARRRASVRVAAMMGMAMLEPT